MISIQEARALLMQHIVQTETEDISLYKALNRFNAESLTAPMDFPSYDQSAMDGYALRFADVTEGASYYVEGEIKAGDTLISPVDPGNCVRIFTGAQMPEGADTVVIQEKVERSEKHISFEEFPTLAQNVRPAGSQTKRGDVVLKQGQRLTASACSLLASLGFENIKAHKAPSVDIIVTGNELVRPPQDLKKGQIFESNSYALRNALNALGCTDIRIRKAIDIKNDLQNKIENALGADLVLITGGVSVGKYDLVSEVLNELGVSNIFHGVNQKPGKPLLFGKKDKTHVFGLPGNPGSVMNCFYVLIRPAIEQIMGAAAAFEPSLQLPIGSDYEKKGGRTEFVKAIFQGSFAMPLGHQQSYKMNSFSEAQCLIEIPAERGLVEKGTLLYVHLI